MATLESRVFCVFCYFYMAVCIKFYSQYFVYAIIAVNNNKKEQIIDTKSSSCVCNAGVHVMSALQGNCYKRGLQTVIQDIRRGCRSLGQCPQ